jgi:predicted AAA+ superfamily ATPase
MLVIDEVQRYPEILLPIKLRVDEDQRAGAFLLTGSAHVMGLRAIPDALPGRVETIELWPFSQGEIDGEPDGFIDAVFGHGVDVVSSEGRGDCVQRVARGGFPESVARSGRRRGAFMRNYIGDLINREVTQVAEIQRGQEFRTLVRLLAAQSGQLVVPAKLSRATGLSQTTVSKYLAIMNEVFLIKLIPAWSRGAASRAVKTPKLAFVDSGIACGLLGHDARALDRRETIGPLLEGFVAMELARQATWSDTSVQLFHYRNKDQQEVDIVLEDARGRVVGIEVKASTTVRGEDFSGLRHLARLVGDDFLAGIVLYAGNATAHFGERLQAVPLPALWTAKAS